MEYTNLGKTGLKVSRICLGCMTYGSPKWRGWILGEDESKPFFRQAVEAGINVFDTADTYSQGISEEVTGRALKEFAGSRESYVLATKVFFPMGSSGNESGLSRKHILHAIDNSLRRLGHDYVDLYQIHRFDPSTPIEETIEALHDVVKAGKVRYIGASSMLAWQFAKYLHTAEAMRMTRFVSMQNHYNLVYREEEREMIPLCREEGIGLIPWSPLARGVLAGNRKAGTVRSQEDDYTKKLYTQEADDRVVESVAQVAKNRGVPPAQVALAWLLHKPEVSAPIVGASKPQHLQDAIAAVDLSLTQEEIAQMESTYVPHPVLGHH